MKRRTREWGLTVILLATLVSTASAHQWTDAMFNNKVSAGRPFIAISDHDLAKAHTVIGFPRYYQIQKKDTLLDIARYYDLGFNEISQANPGIDEWVPPPGQIILLPTEWVLPDVAYKGIVLNIPEMRLFYFVRGGEGTTIVRTFPVGLGRDTWRTPIGKFKVAERDVNPPWILPESIKEEHRKDGRPAPNFIPGGAPDNPLGHFRLRLSSPLYGIHGTDIPWGVGMQVSHGCVRLYPEDIARLYPTVPLGTPVNFVYQPVKVGARGGHIYVEVHTDIYNRVPALYQDALRLLDKFGWRPRVDIRRVQRAVLEQSGVPMDVTLEAPATRVKDEVLPPPPAPRDRQVTAQGDSRLTADPGSQ